MGLAYPRAIGVLSGRPPEPEGRAAAPERRIVLLGRSAPAALRELIVGIPGFAVLPAPNRFPGVDRELAGDAVAVVYGPAAGAEVTELRTRTGVCPPILAISPSPDVAVAIEVLRRGATSYLVDGEYTRADLAAALRTTARGQSATSPVITTALVRRFHGQRCTVEGNRLELLTPRERDLLRLLADGHSNTQIADQLCLAEKTVRNYISRLYTKLGVASRAEAIVWWLRRATP